jgi:hypothetical protein
MRSSASEIVRNLRRDGSDTVATPTGPRSRFVAGRSKLTPARHVRAAPTLSRSAEVGESDLRVGKPTNVPWRPEHVRCRGERVRCRRGQAPVARQEFVPFRRVRGHDAAVLPRDHDQARLCLVEARETILTAAPCRELTCRDTTRESRLRASLATGCARSSRGRVRVLRRGAGSRR